MPHQKQPLLPKGPSNHIGTGIFPLLLCYTLRWRLAQQVAQKEKKGDFGSIHSLTVPQTMHRTASNTFRNGSPIRSLSHGSNQHTHTSSTSGRITVVWCLWYCHILPLCHYATLLLNVGTLARNIWTGWVMDTKRDATHAPGIKGMCFGIPELKCIDESQITKITNNSITIPKKDPRSLLVKSCDFYENEFIPIYIYASILFCAAQGGGSFKNRETYRRGSLLWITDGRGNRLINRKVVGVVSFGVVTVVAVVTWSATPPTTAGCSVV